MKAQYAAVPAKLGWRSWRRSFVRALKRVMDSDMTLRMAGVAFYGLLSIFPMLALAVLLYGMVLDPATLRSHLDVAAPFLPDNAYSLIEDRLATLMGTSRESLGIGAIVATLFVVWSSSHGTSSMMTLMGIAYRQPDRRHFARFVLVSIALTVCAILFGFLAVLVVATIPIVFAFLPSPAITEVLVKIGGWVTLGVLAFVGICAFYRLAPDRRDPTLGWVAPGAFIATLGWVAASLVFSIYVENFGTYDAMFGTLSAVIVLMLWFYLTVVIFTFGASLNAELELSTRLDTTVGPNRPMGERGAFVADHTVDELP